MSKMNGVSAIGGMGNNTGAAGTLRVPQPAPPQMQQAPQATPPKQFSQRHMDAIVTASQQIIAGFAQREAIMQGNMMEANAQISDLQVRIAELEAQLQPKDASPQS